MEERKPLKKPDLKAPRFRLQTYEIVSNEFVKKFKEKFPKYAHLSIREIKKYIKAVNEEFYKTVIDERDGVELPEGVGIIFIGTCQTPIKKNISFEKSFKYGVELTNTNLATDGKLAKIVFTSFNARYKFSNREYWSFVACRNFKRSVARTYPDNWNMYIVLDPLKKVRETYNELKRKAYLQYKMKSNTKGINNFDL